MGRQLQDALKAAGLMGIQGDSLKQSRTELSSRRATATNFPDAVKAVVPPSARPREMEQGQQKPQLHPRNMSPTDRRHFVQAAPPGRNPVRTGIQEASHKTKAAPAVRPISRLVKTGDFHPHPLFTRDALEEVALPVLRYSGIESQLSSDPENAADMIIGLDFGTSATKVVVRDSTVGIVFPVRINGGRPGIDGYLHASCVYLNGSVYSLSAGGDCLDDLKLALLACEAALPVTEFNHCCAFLALIIRRARGWLLTEHHDIYRQHELTWCLNLGLAARSYQEEAKVKVFRRLAWAASNLAADASVVQIDSKSVDDYRKLSQKAFGEDAPEEVNGMEFSADDIGVVPEVSAQIQGFMTSARWDWKNRPIMMLVDVGAGTVDSTLFHVKSGTGSVGVLTFYSSRVEPNGAMNLHRERVSWLQRTVPETEEFASVHAYLNSIEKPTGRLRPIPAADVDYLPGYQIEKACPSADDEFRLNRYRKQVAGSINDAKVKKGLGARGSQQLRKVPLLLCGGGSRLPIYSSIASEINDTTGWGDVSVEMTRMPVPVELRDTGWHLEEFDRISVAYGLSLTQSLEKIVRNIEVPDVNRQSSESSADRFVSKDQM